MHAQHFCVCVFLAHAQGGYQLMTAFPSQLVEDESKTLEAAGLLNAVLIQKRV